MPNYDFVIKDHLGRNYRGTFFGPTEQAVFFRLQKSGYIVLSVTEKQEKEGFSLFNQSISQGDIAVFTKLLSTVIKTGLPAQEAIAAIEEQTENRTLRKVIRQVREDIENGMSMSAAFEKHPKTFPHLFVSMVHSGEISGSITEVLDRVAEYLEKDSDLRRSIKQAFTYPKIILTIAVGAMVIIMTKVIPAYTKIYAQTKVKLPYMTKVLMDISNFLQQHWIPVFAVIGLIIMGFVYLKNSPIGRPYYDMFVMKIPFLGPINRRILVSRTVRTLGSMLKSGVPLITSLETCKSVVNNYHLEKDIESILENVEAGNTISSTIRLSKNFLPVVIYMFSSGESSGRLPDLLLSCSDVIEKEIAFYTKRLITILEPMLTIFVALIVAFIAIAMYLPIFNFLTFLPK